MDAWTARVTEAAADWVYVPDDAQRHVTDEYAIVGYQASFRLPTQVMRIRSSRPRAELVREVDDVVRSWGRSEVSWWIDPATAPAELEDHLQALGAELVETVTVLAVDLTAPLPDFAVPAGVRAAVVTDVAGLHDFGRVNGTGWDSPLPTADDLARLVAEARTEQSFRVVASADDEPIATGGMSLVGDVARLWAGVTLPSHRGRGGYRAVLAERLRVARERGATIGLVKGRVTTSAPILRRLGFDVFDDERAWRRSVA